MGATRERRQWLREHAEEIIAYHAGHGVKDTISRFGIGQHTLTKLFGQGQQRQASAAVAPLPATITEDNAGDLLLDALLSRMESLKAELAEAKAKLESQSQLKETILDLRQQLSKAEEERDRVIKLHNEQVAKKRLGKITLGRVREALE